MARIPEKAFRDLAKTFPYLAEKEKFRLDHPQLLDLEAKAARLQALSDWLVMGEVNIERGALVDKQAAQTIRVWLTTPFQIQGFVQRQPLPTEVRKTDQDIARLNNYRWESSCRGLYQLPIIA